jgi:hypothetical protein
MVSARRRDDRPIKRHPATRAPKRRILIVCEGRVTERTYFKQFQHEFRNSLVHVEVARESGVPMTVVQEAIRLRDEALAEAKAQRDENSRWDDVWGVFDIDEHPNVVEAKDRARAAGIELAISNPCFELWGLLHFQDQRAHIERHAAASALRAHMPTYTKELDFYLMKPLYEEAVQRARKLDAEANHHSCPARNPTTSVFRLTELIRGG